jgi:hypothetical protein
MEREIQDYKIPNFIILTVAWIDLKEAKPILKKAYLNNSPNFDRYYLQIALAKLGDKDALNDLFKLDYVYKITDWQCTKYSLVDYIFPLKFIGSQESIFQIHRLLDTTSKCTEYGTDDITRKIYSATKIIKQFNNLFQNPSFKLVTNNFDFNYYYWDRVITADIIYRIKNWITDNKGKYELNKEQILFEKYSLQDQYFPKLW